MLPEKLENKTLAGLRHASKYIHRLIADEVSMGSVPQLDFRIDHTLKKEAEVLLALRRAKEQDAALQAGGVSAESTDDVQPAPITPEIPTPETDAEAPSEPQSEKRTDKEKSRPRNRRVSGDALDETIKPDRRRKNSTRPRKDPQ